MDSADDGRPRVVPFARMRERGDLVDVDATLDHFRTTGFTPEQTGIVGFCFGGRVVFLVAARRRLGAAVTFYGGGIVSARVLPFDPLIGEAGNLETPWLGLFGDKDPMIPVEDVEKLREAVVAATVDTEIVRYPDGGTDSTVTSGRTTTKHRLRTLGDGRLTGLLRGAGRSVIPSLPFLGGSDSPEERR